MIPVVPALIWLAAAACLILLMLVVFGYHGYQRSRMAALAADAGDIGSLAGKKERLEADIAAMRQWLQEQQAELQKFDADRRRQELLRIELGQLERSIAERKKESEASLKFAAGLEASLVKKRNLLTRLEADIKDLEKERAGLEPMREQAAKLRLELDQGKVKLALLAEQEIRTGALQRQAEELASGLAELREVIEPLQKEKQRLRAYIDQARHTVAVKTERAREMNALLRELESACHELKSEKQGLELKVRDLAREREEQEEFARKLARDSERTELEQRKANLQAELGQLGAELQHGQASIFLLREQAEEERKRLEQPQAKNSGSARRLQRKPRRGNTGSRSGIRLTRPQAIYQDHAEI